MTGRQDLFALFGNPVVQSLSPLMHNAVYGAMGLPARYEAFQVGDPEEAIRMIREKNIRGASVTIPFKTAVMAFLDEVDEDARFIGAVNTIRNRDGRLEGFNTDWLGLMRSLGERLEIRGKRFAILGSGGAARAAVFGIAREGGIPVIFCRNPETGKVLSRDLGCLALPMSRLDTVTAHCLINATPVGMAPGEGKTPVDGNVLERFEWVMDMIYNPLRTKLLDNAEAVGCGVISGLPMFVYQGAEQIRIWTGMKPPVDIMATAVREELLRRGSMKNTEEKKEIMTAYMPNLDEIRTIEKLDAVVNVPGSKSYTQRALVISALAEGKTFLRNPLFSEDTQYTMEALRLFGAEIVSSGEDVIVTGTAGKVANPGAGIYLGNNGTAMRFLAGTASLGKGDFLLTGDHRLCERPMKPLLDALRSLGTESTCQGKDGCPPVVIHAGGMRGGRVIFEGVESSQYISSILISAPYAKGDVQIELRGPVVSRPYIDMTVDVMNAFGVPVEREGGSGFRVTGGRCYDSGRFLVEADVSSASYFFLAAALCRGRVRVANINPQTLQGDIGFLRILEDLGCTVSTGDSWVEITGKTLRSGECSFDMGDMPDMVPTLAVLAAVRPGRTVVRNVAHLRIKESNRLKALARELTKVGIGAGETEDGIVIEGGRPRGAEIESYNDHRIAMSFAMLGLVVRGIRIRDRECVRKSFSGFWEEMRKLYSRP